MLNPIVVAAFCCIASVHSMSLPSYIVQCSLSSPDLDECVMNAANKAIPNIVEGDKMLKIPSLKPLKVKKVDLDNAGLNMHFTDIEVRGLEDVVISKVQHSSVDQNTKEWMFNGRVPQVNFKIKYNLDGRILILPIKGEGPGNITYTDCEFTYMLKYELTKKDGTAYAKAISDDITLKTGKNYFQLENLFNGDKTLGDQMNVFLNENQDEVTKIVDPAITGTIRQIIFKVFDKLFKVVPYSDLFLP